MNKITSINLNGRAYQLEEQAYTALKHYLQQAESKLADDPDKAEIMQDFEQAVADKCDQVLKGHKNVVTSAEMNKIIGSMGSVEVEDEEGEHAKHHRAEYSTPPVKRFYTLREGAIFGGVCSGLAAYLNVDVTIVRLAFVLLTLFTGGGWILAYFLIMIFAPEAKTPEQKAELRGERFTAQDLLKRAKQKYNDMDADQRLKDAAARTAPALSNAGQIVVQILRVLSGLVATIAGLFLAALTSGMAVALWAIIRGQLRLTDQLASVARWEWALAVAVGYLLIALPTVLVAQVLAYVAAGKQFSRQAAWRWLILGGAMWLAAFITSICLMITLRGPINDYQNTHDGYIDVRGHHICIDDTICGDNGDPDTSVPSCRPYPMPYRGQSINSCYYVQ